MYKFLLSNNTEKLFFFIVALLNAMPIFLYKFFPSMDGAVHVHNAQNIVELLSNPESRLHDYMIFNPALVPNWGGHIVLSLFSLFLPAFLAEKSLFLIYFIGLPLAFRFFITKGMNQQPYLSYLIFPLVYTFLLGLGFYNLSLALILLFINLGFWLKIKEKRSGLKMVYFFLLVTVLYFTHMFVFVVFGLSILVFFVWDLITDLTSEKVDGNIQKSFKKILFIIGGFSLSLILLIRQLFFSGEFTLKGQSKSLSLDQLLDGIWHIRGSIIYSKGEEGNLNLIFFGMIAILTIFILLQRLRKVAPKKSPNADALIITALILLILYFVVPNNLPGKGGHMSFRFIIAFYLFWVAWIAAHKIPGGVIIPAIVITLGVTFLVLSKRSVRINRLSDQAQEIYTLSKHIEPESVVLPLNYSKNWLHPHFSSFLGYKKPMIILQNYELGKRVFPLVWKPDMPKVLLGGKRNNQVCTWWKSNNKNKTNIDTINYVFFWGKKRNDCRKQLEQLVKKNYRLVDKTKRGKLYKLKE